MKKLIFSIIPALLITGCCINSSPSTEYFTIDTGSTFANYNYNIEISPIASNELYGQKMVFLKTQNSIFFDNFNKWAQTPDKMITSYFDLYFNNPAAPPLKGNYTPLKLSANILKLDCNITNKECLLSIKVSVVNSPDNKLLSNTIYTEKQPISKLSAASFASSTSVTLKSIAKKIEESINAIHQKQNIKKGTQ